MSNNKRQRSFSFSEGHEVTSGPSESAPVLTGQDASRKAAATGEGGVPGGRTRRATSAAVTSPAPMKPSSADEQPVDQKEPGQPGWLAGKRVYVVDAHALIYQVFHALSDAHMSSPDGQPVGAVHGFTRDVLDLLEKHHPDYFFCAFDHPGDNYRNRIYTEYKANREAMPEELRPQIGAIQRMLKTLGVPVLSVPDYEADDILATLARDVEAAGGECVLVTNDKDCRQLITDHVTLFNIRKNAYYDAASLENDWGIRPDQVVDFQSLVGDSTDNVPGVPLFGPKLTRDLIQQFGTLDEILRNTDQVSGKKRKENLERFRDQALISRDLVRLHPEVPLTIDWQEARPGRYDIEAALALCQELGFRTIAERIGGLASGHVGGAAEVWEADYRTVATADELQALVEQAQQQSRVVVDTETTSTHPRLAEIVGYSLAWKPGEAYYIPVRAPEGDEQLDPAIAKEIIGPLLEDRSIEKLGQNLKYDIVVLRGAGIRLAGKLFDTMVADYLLEPGQRNHNMDELSARYLGHETIKITELIGKGKQQKRMDEVPVALVTPYAAEDADVPLRLADRLGPQLDEQDLSELFHDVEMPLVEVLAELEFNGIKVDQPYLRQLGEEFGKKIDQLEQQIHALAGHAFNIDSPQQLATVLFDEIGLPVVKKTKTGRSTDVEVLNQLAATHELPAAIIEYRQFAKLKNTYVDALLELVHPQTERIHTSFMQDVAATGRLSSKDPNLQNIPVRTEAGRKIRSAFLAGQKDWRLLAADYSQIELRVLAHYAQDEALLSAFTNDEDIHARVAAEVAGVDLADVTSEMRRRAKAINFGIIYGQSPFGLAKALDISQEEAAAFIDAYFQRYPGVDRFITEVLDQAHRTRSVSTILGRRRPVQGVRGAEARADSRQRILPERIAVNTVIQGSAADIIKLAMINLYRRLQAENTPAWMLLQIHDELVLEAPQDEIERLAEIVRREMESVIELSVPLKVDVKAGVNWGNCEPIGGG